MGLHNLINYAICKIICYFQLSVPFWFLDLSDVGVLSWYVTLRFDWFLLNAVLGWNREASLSLVNIQVTMTVITDARISPIALMEVLSTRAGQYLSSDNNFNCIHWKEDNSSSRKDIFFLADVFDLMFNLNLKTTSSRQQKDAIFWLWRPSIRYHHS